MNSDFCVAAHALVYLGHKNTTVSSERLAKNICTHPARVRRILGRLRKQGFLETVESGPNSGYRLSENPRAITLGQIAKAMEIKFADPGWRSGSVDQDCLIASGMGDAMDAIFGELNELCYTRLDQITIYDLEKQLLRRQTAGEQ